MIKRLILQKWWIVMAAMVSIAAGQSPIKLAALPTLSPDAKTVIFEWRDDLWEGPIEGGRARRLTTHPAYDGQPRYSPDGKSILFQSDRNGYMQIHQMSREGANPQPVSFLTERTQLNDIYPDGNSLLVEGVRDQAGSRPYRLLKLDLSGTKPEELLFDEEARQGRLSPDAGRLLFVREGVELYRKGYYGTQAAQIWLYDFATKQFEQPVCSAFGCLSPLWAPDGKSFYYLRGDLGVFNLHYYHLETKQDRQLTQFRDDSIIFPDLSLDGTYLVFRKGFDFWRLSTAEGAVPEKIEFWHGEDLPQPSSMPLTLTSANSADFSSSGLEIIFESEGDLWVMDTVLMKPVNLTATPHLIETQPSFSADNQYIYFVEDDGVNSQLKRIKRKNSAIYWWKKPELEQQQLTYDDSVKTEYVLSPKLDRIAYQANQGDLWVMKTDGTEAKRLVEAWSELAVSWSPDGQWLAYSREDNDFNRDIWIISADGEVGPVNVSRHPDLDVNPIWSPDGKKLAFMGRRTGTNLDIYYLYLTKEEATLSDLDEQLKKATEAMEKDPNYKGKSSPVEKPKAPAEKVKEAIQQLADAMPKATPNSGAVSQAKDKAKTNTTAKVAAPERLKIDFEDIHDRIRHIPLGQNQISSMDWAKDSKSLICATRGGRTMISASIGDKTEVKSFAEKGLLPKRVDSSSGKMFGLSQNLPAVLDNGKLTTYPFRAYSERDFSSYQRLMFRTLWRLMRDTFYDEGMNGKTGTRSDKNTKRWR